MSWAIKLSIVLRTVVALWVMQCLLPADDWPMLGRDGTRNGVSAEINPPTLWTVVDTTDKERRLLPRNRMSGNIKWSVQLGSQTGGDPVVANGLVWIGTNNTPLDDFSQFSFTRVSLKG